MTLKMLKIGSFLCIIFSSKVEMSFEDTLITVYNGGVVSFC